MYRIRKTLIKICCLKRISKNPHQLHNIHKYKSVFRQRALLLRLVNARPGCLRLASGRDGEPGPESFITVESLRPRATSFFFLWQSHRTVPINTNSTQPPWCLKPYCLHMQQMAKTFKTNTTWMEKGGGGERGVFKTKQKPENVRTEQRKRVKLINFRRNKIKVQWISHFVHIYRNVNKLCLNQ